LRDYGENPLGAEMLILRDVAEGINRLVEAERKLAELEAVLNDTRMKKHDGTSICSSCHLI
jgi:hypothetical protein